MKGPELRDLLQKHLVFQIRCCSQFQNINREIPVFESLFDKVAGLEAYNFIKKRLQHRCFPANVAKFLRAVFAEQLRWLPLLIPRAFHVNQLQLLKPTI